MHQQVTIALPLLIVLAVVEALVVALLVRYLVLKRVRREEIVAVANHVDTLFKTGALRALRFQPGSERMLARGVNTTLEVPVRERARELGAGSFVDIDGRDLRDAVDHLRRQKTYQMVDWREEGEGRLKELTLRPEFADVREPLA